MSETAIIPVPRIAIQIREGILADVPFLDSLQKIHTRQVGWMPTKTLEGKVNAGHVLVAEDEARQAIGYCIGNDRYFKHDNVGIIYQLNVAPGKQRNLVGAQLVKAMFDRAAEGCKLFCLWCAQDIEANYFWESLGFVPLAFRAGSRKKGRVHIFWQKRIREGDTTTEWWYPYQTGGGSIREDRLVLPIPPGMHWNDALPIIVPEEPSDAIALPAPKEDAKPRRVDRGADNEPPSKAIRGLWTFAANQTPPKQKPKRPKRPKAKCDPRLAAAARLLRDRHLERVNVDPSLLPEPVGKYQVCRKIELMTAKEIPLLPGLAA